MSSRIILRCTTRLLRELDPKTVRLDTVGRLENADSWCLNLVWIERKKCLFASHQGSMFTLFVPDLRRAQLRRLPVLFAAALEEALDLEGLRPGWAVDPESAIITRTNSRSVLGTMNELVFECRWRIAEQGGLAFCDLSKIRRALNRTLTRVDGGEYDEAIRRVMRVSSD